MMIRLAAQYGHGAVYLLGKQQWNHLVREGHARERNQGVGTLLDLGREAVGASHDKDYALGHASGHAALNLAGKLARGVLSAVFVEKPQEIAGTKRCNDIAAFHLTLLILGHGTGGLDIGHRLYGIVDISADTQREVLDQAPHMGVGRPPYRKQSYFHNWLFIPNFAQRYKK